MPPENYEKGKYFWETTRQPFQTMVYYEELDKL